jgi:ribosomal-protein-alanine N-acetyltransferase
MIAGVAVRLATLNDVSDIAAMSRDYIEQGLSWRWRDAKIAKAIRDPEVNVVVVGNERAVTAFGIMSYSEEDAHLLLFAVRRSSQRKGVGTALLIWLEAVARAAGAQRIRVEARAENVGARCFYSEHGYHERLLKKAMYDEKVDGVRLEKWLRSDA